MSRLRRLFRWTPPKAVVATPLDPYEAKIMSAWGYTPASWARLTPQQRAVRREGYTKAPRYVG